LLFHDLHIWTITSGLNSLTCHLLIESHEKEQAILQQALTLIERNFGITHTTIQIEKRDLQHKKLDV